MRVYPILLLAVGLTLAACGEETADPSTDGTLVVSTVTGGDDPDEDGYLLLVDGVDSLDLDPTGTAEIDLPVGRHTLQLLRVAVHCSVAPATPLEVDVPSQDTTSVAFEVSCPATGVRVTTATTGLDFDSDGYRVEVDGTDRGVLPSNGTVLTRLDSGSHTIALTGLSPTCTTEGPGSRTVTVVEAEVTVIDFAVACTATSGVIGVVVEASGTDVEGDYVARLDGARPFPVSPSRTGYLAAVAAGDHVVSLVGPGNCFVESDPQSVTVTVGGLIRDTAEATFLVTCRSRSEATLWITAPTSGPIPADNYSVWICDAQEYYCRYGGLGSLRLGALEPNGILAANVAPGEYALWLRSVPANCSVQDDNGRLATVQAGRVLYVEFPVRCAR